MAAAVTAATNAIATRRPARALRFWVPILLKDSTDDDVEMVAIRAAEGSIDAEHDAVVGVEAEPDAVVRFEILEVQILTLVGHFARIVEDGAVEAAPDFPTVLGLGQDGVRRA